MTNLLPSDAGEVSEGEGGGAKMDVSANSVTLIGEGDASGRAADIDGRDFGDEGASDGDMNYRRFFEVAIEMLATATLDGRFKTVNESFVRVLGHSRAELLSRPLVDLVHPDDKDATLDQLSRLANGERMAAFENRYRCSDGHYRWLRWSATPSMDDGLLYAVAVDVTDDRAKDDAMSRIVSDLERSNEELSQFAYVASHDLSEPLRVVAGHVELLARRYEGRLDADADGYIQFAVEGCARMRALIDDLLAFSRAGRDTQADETFNLGDVMTDVIASLDTVITEAGATITVRDLPTVVGSSSQFGQVLSNLITNALKFRQPGSQPSITICGQREAGGWRIELEDDGIGVEPAYRQRIFRIFQRLHGRETYPGTGIGLAICRKMVELRGGKIWCTGADPHGTKFCFTIPDRFGS